MTLPLSARIAMSLLLARWRQSAVAAIGVTFGITMFIALLGFMSGLNVLLDSLFLNRTPHIRLYNEPNRNREQPVTLFPGYKNHYHFISSVKAGNSHGYIRNSVSIRAALQKNEAVSGFTPQVKTPMFFNIGATRYNGFVYGIEIENENKLFHFSEYVVAGNSLQLNSIPNSIILGKKLAELLAANTGDVIDVTNAEGVTFPLKIVGLYQSGVADIDKVTGYTSVSTAQRILQKPSDYVTDINIRLHDMAAAPALALEFNRKFNVSAMDIQTANKEFETGTNIRTLISYVVGITLLIVAGFGIYNILNMIIFEKMDSIAILKATGFSSKDIRNIFLQMALSIGLSGGLLGLGLGYVFCLIIDSVPFHPESLPTVTTYPVSYDPFYYVVSLSFAVSVTMLAGWLPARKAGKIDPVVIIRGK